MAEIYRWQDAVRAAQQWQSVRPFDPNSYLAIIKGSLKLGNVNRAELAWNKLVRLQPVPSARLFACWINALDEEGFHKQAQHQKLLAVEHGIDVSGLSHNFDVGEGVFQGCQ